MAAIKFSKQYIEPNPNEIDYWVDLSSNQYGGRMKYYNGFEWVDLINPDGTHIDINDFYNKLQINQMLSQKASVDSVESKVDDDEVSDVIKNISFSQRGEDGVEMVMFKYDDTTVGIQLPIADNTKSGIITKDTFKNLVNQTQLQQLYSEMYTKLSEIRNNYQPKLRAGANIKIENNVISAVSKIGTDWNDIANKPDIYDKSQVDTMMSGVYKIKGSRRFEALPLYTNAVGDTYNITNDFSLHGEDYPMGTNVVWTENGWDALAGIFDTSELEEDIQEVKDNYLPLTGGTINGTTSLYKDGATPLTITTNQSNASIAFKNNSVSAYSYLTYGPTGFAVTDAGWNNLYKIWHEGNDGEGSGLDADTLDGYHLNNVFANRGWKALDANEILFGVYYQGGSNSTNMPSKNGLLIAFNDGDVDYKGGLLFFRTNGSIDTRMHWNGKWSPWKTIAFTNSNVASATKLATPVKIWGNDFDGSSSINDDLVIDNSKALRINNVEGEPISLLGLNANNNFVLGYGAANKQYQTYLYGYALNFHTGNPVKQSMAISTLGYVGIGTNSPRTNLHIEEGNFLIHRETGSPLVKIEKGDLGVSFLIDSFKGLYDHNNSKWIIGSTTAGNTILNCGNVGIGKDNPLTKLDVNGTVNATQFLAEPDKGYCLKNSNDENFRTMFLASSGYLSIGHDTAQIGAYETIIEGNYVNLRYGRNHKNGFILNASGNVTIGSSDLASTNNKLCVDGTSVFNDHVTVKNSVNVWHDLFVDGNITSGDLVDWYGVSWSEDSSDPTCTRIGNMALHRSLPILSAMKGYYIGNIQSACPECMLPLNDNWSKLHYNMTDNGEVTVTSFVSGNIMVKIPEFWYIDEYDGTTKTHNLKISQSAKAGWCHHKEAYVGAYEGRSYDTYYKSVKGVIPTVSLSRTELRQLARANGYEDEYKWNIYTYEEHRAICHLFLVEYATRNSQLAVNTALTADGFKQGGLGSGCTTGTVKINGVDTYSFIPTGTTDSLGNGSGQVAYTVTLTDADGNELGTVTRYANRYRGIENPFGHIWKHVDDVINIYNSSLTYKTVYKCEKPEYFATNKNAKYKPICSFPGGSKMVGWSKEIKATINCDFFKYSVGGSESTYWCDYNYDSDDTSEHCLLIGGCSDYGGRAGLFYFTLSRSVGYSSVYIGSRLTYLPWAE